MDYFYDNILSTKIDLLKAITDIDGFDAIYDMLEKGKNLTTRIIQIIISENIHQQGTIFAITK